MAVVCYRVLCSELENTQEEEKAVVCFALATALQVR